MAHTCHRCGAQVEDAVPFCPECQAPQIRYKAQPDQDLGGTVRVEHEIAPPPSIQRPTPSESGGFPHHPHFFARAAFAGGAIGALLSMVPFAFVVALPAAGFLAVRFYRRWTSSEVNSRFGFRLGTVSGLVGFAITIVLTAAAAVFSTAGSELRDAMIASVRRQMERAPDLQARQMLEYFLTPPGLAIMMIVGLAFMCGLFVLLAGVGGMAGAGGSRRGRSNSQNL